MKSKRPNTPDSESKALLLIGLIWLATRVGFYFVYTPGVDLDSETYLALGRQIIQFNFLEYNGQRTPGYPLLLSITGANHKLIWIIQSCMSLCTASLLYLISRDHGSNKPLALAISISYLLISNTIVYESAVLTETVSAFLLVLTVFFFLKAFRQGIFPILALCTGITVAALVLTRPQYIFLLPLLALLTCLLKGRRWISAIIFIFVSSAPVVGWMSFNQQHIGHFSLTSLLGYNLSNHTGAFMEKASEKHALYRDIYVRYRDEKIVKTGGHHMTIFEARNELKQVSGLDEVGLSFRFQQISTELILQNPLLYIQSVAKAWASFWAVPRYVQPQSMKSSSIATAMDWLWKIQHPLLRLLNVAFLLSSFLLAIFIIRYRHIGITQFVAPAFIATIVLLTSVVQALAEYGENPRYFIPSQPLVITATALSILVFIQNYRHQSVLSNFGRR